MRGLRRSIHGGTYSRWSRLVNVISDRYPVAGMAVAVGTFAGTRISSLDLRPRAQFHLEEPHKAFPAALEIETLEIGAKLVG